VVVLLESTGISMGLPAHIDIIITFTSLSIQQSRLGKNRSHIIAQEEISAKPIEKTPELN